MPKHSAYRFPRLPTPCFQMCLPRTNLPCPDSLPRQDTCGTTSPLPAAARLPKHTARMVAAWKQTWKLTFARYDSSCLKQGGESAPYATAVQPGGMLDKGCVCRSDRLSAASRRSVGSTSARCVMVGATRDMLDSRESRVAIGFLSLMTLSLVSGS